jgi:hypothetical protein
MLMMIESTETAIANVAIVYLFTGFPGALL